jgi:WD40 repeat protein
VPTKAGTFEGSWGDALWVNDETMLLYIAQPHPEYPDASPLMIKALLNPLTGEWQPTYLEGLERKQTGTVSFAPDMTRVLFYSEAEGRLPEIQLWDREREAILWSQEDLQDTFFTSDSKNWTGSAAWSPDSNWVAFTAVESRNEDGWSLGVGVYLLDREGGAGKIITDFHVRYGPPFTAGTLSWSPDGRYLAMSVSIAGSDSDGPYVQEDRFYLYDLKNDDLLDLCWSRELHSGYNSTMRTLVWSPDSRYLAYVANVSVLEDGQRLPRTLILVDIYTGEVIELVENAVRLGGWSAHFVP